MAELLGNKVNPQVLIIGVFHGDEPQGDYLVREYYKANPNTKLLMIPCLNESGFKAKTRVNSNKVDLNRNFPTKNWVLGEKDDYYGGSEPASEDETKFVIDVVERYSPDVILTIHAPYKVVNYDGGDTCRAIAESISQIIGYPVEADIGYPTPGSFGTWAGKERGISVITLELDEEVSVNELKTPIFKVFNMLEGMS